MPQYRFTHRCRSILSTLLLCFFLLLTISSTATSSVFAASFAYCEVDPGTYSVVVGTSITVRWDTGDSAEATLNGVAVALGRHSRVDVIMETTTYTLRTRSGDGTATCTSSVTVEAVPPPPTTPPPTTPPGGGPSSAEAFLAVYTSGFVTPVTTSERTIEAAAAVERLLWSSRNAVRCEGEEFLTGDTVSGELTGPHASLIIEPGTNKTYRLRCVNTAGTWSPWVAVTIRKNPTTDTPPPGGGGNRAPLPPDIFGADVMTAAAVEASRGTVLPFTFRATDPDNDSIRYDIDWNNDSVSDVALPDTGYVLSGTERSATYRWDTIGTYTFAARTRDNRGAVSSWRTHTVRITDAGTTLPPPPPEITLLANPELVRAESVSEITLRIEATYPVSCTLFGVAGGSIVVAHGGTATPLVHRQFTEPLVAAQEITAYCISTPPIGTLPDETRRTRVNVVPLIEEI